MNAKKQTEAAESEANPTEGAGSDAHVAKKDKTVSKASIKKALPYMQNRELSWLSFNKRVLDQGEDHNVPLLERLTFVAIFSSNLQEFFMVRVGSLTDLSLVKKELRENKTLMTPDEQIRAIHERCHELYPEQERIFEQLQNRLAHVGIRQLQPKDLNEEQETYLRNYLHDKVSPFLSPQIINARHPFPHLENGALYVLLRLNEEHAANDSSKSKKKGKNVGANDATFGLIPLPQQAERIIKLPGGGFQFILLENAIKLLVDEVFSMYNTKRSSIICVTRNADIDANDGMDDTDYDYREHMKRILKKRSRLAPVRLETDTPLSSVTEKFLLKRLNLEPHQVYVTKVPLDMSYAWQISSLIDDATARKVTNKPLTPSWPACLDKNRPIIEQVCEHDVLLSYPYESMDPFVYLLREAANDPSVLSIKITLYRLASQSHLAEALLTAAENGKEVTALFELRARFDESNNIEWSQRFEQAGAHVIYGFHDFKVHSKICAITRHSEQGIQHITQLGTGNYNEKTSKLYTDFSFITTNESVGKDAAEFFRNMGLENASNNYQYLSVAPLQIKPLIMEKIDEQIERARQGLPNGVFFKTNSVTDKEIIDKIAEASQEGVHTTLLVRGISCIIPGVEGYTDNVEVVSIVGRLLEHSRIYGFGTHDDMEIYLASADLMTRNMDKRIEIAWPIKEESLRKQVIDYIDISLSDTAKLRKLQNNLEYTPLEYFASVNKAGVIDSFDSQNYLIEKAEKDYEASVKLREEEALKRSEAAQAQRVRDYETLRYAAHVHDPEEEYTEKTAETTVDDADERDDAADKTASAHETALNENDELKDATETPSAHNDADSDKDSDKPSENETQQKHTNEATTAAAITIQQTKPRAEMSERDRRRAEQNQELLLRVLFNRKKHETPEQHKTSDDVEEVETDTANETVEKFADETFNNVTEQATDTTDLLEQGYEALQAASEASSLAQEAALVAQEAAQVAAELEEDIAQETIAKATAVAQKAALVAEQVLQAEAAANNREEGESDTQDTAEISEDLQDENVTPPDAPTEAESNPEQEETALETAESSEYDEPEAESEFDIDETAPGAEPESDTHLESEPESEAESETEGSEFEPAAEPNAESELEPEPEEPAPATQQVIAEVLPLDEKPSPDAIQLVAQTPQKIGFFKRLKFLFTGHF